MELLQAVKNGRQSCLLRAAVSLTGSIHKTQTQKSLTMALSLNRKKVAQISDKRIYPFKSAC